MRYFKWCEQVQLVRGNKRSLLCDLQRNEYRFIPNEICDIIKNYDGSTVDYVRNKFREYTFKKIADEWWNDFEINEYFFCLHKKFAIRFSKLSLKWYNPSQITNAIIEYNGALSEKKLKVLFEALNLLNCKHLTLNFIGVNSIKKINDFLQRFEGSIFQSIDIYHIGEFSFSNEQVIDLLKNNLRINNFYIIVQNEKSFKKSQKKKQPNIIYLQNRKSNRIVPALMLSLPMFLESQQHNTYFNRKLFVDRSGAIRNSPESLNDFGNINNISSASELKRIICTPSFQQYWHVKKEQTDVCKICEFRHICIDKRIPLKRDNNTWYHNIECEYNPYIAKWKGEEGYLTLEESGIKCNETGLRIEKKKLEKVNAELWGE